MYCGRHILIHLKNCHAEATLEAASRPLGRWLEGTFGLVPRGEEGSWIDWDASLRHLAPDARPKTD
jgi:hypothetical protein